MSYYQQLQFTNVQITPDNFRKLRDAIRENPPDLDRFNIGTPGNLGLSCWDFNQDTGQSDIIDVEFRQSKATDYDCLIMDFIAPFVVDNSYIEMQGEDRDYWRWTFIGGKCYETYGELIWPDPVIDPPAMGFVKGTWVPV